MANSEKIAVGLLICDVQPIAGDTAASHRYCGEVLLPLLRVFASRKEYRTTLAFSGSGLEFLAAQYPDALKLLRSLVDSGRVELLASTYTPSLWVAYPARDLAHSIAMTERALQQLGLPAANIFFDIGGFFGPGLAAAVGRFPAAVCRDEIARWFAPKGERLGPAYNLSCRRPGLAFEFSSTALPEPQAPRSCAREDMLVLISANHILGEMALRFIQGAGPGALQMSEFHRARLEEFVVAGAHSAAGSIDVEVDGSNWHWYHHGDAYHFTTPSSPRSPDTFYCDPEWMQLALEIFDGLLENGYRMGTIAEMFATAANNTEARLLPMVEAGPSPQRRRGVAAWMGRQERGWQNQSGLLVNVWRARSALRRCECVAAACTDLPQKTALEAVIAEAWQHQILAESAKPLGPSPWPCEVAYGRERCDQVLRLCAAIEWDADRPAPLNAGGRGARAPVEAEIIGGEGKVVWREFETGLYVCEARFRGNERVRGIRFKCSADQAAYCPSGAEGDLQRVEIAHTLSPDCYLPLSNGLIRLGHDLHLWRDNGTVAIAARVSREEAWATFAVEGEPEERPHEWRFFLARGEAGAAVKFANRCNAV